jgi:hypothetical protein
VARKQKSIQKTRRISGDQQMEQEIGQKTQKNQKIKKVGEQTVSNVIQKSKWKQTTPRELDSHLLLSPCRQARSCDD